jgi:hypothetical protein
MYLILLIMCLWIRIWKMIPSELLDSAWAALLEEHHEKPGQYYRRLATGEPLAAYAGLVLPGPRKRLSLGVETLDERQGILKEKAKGYLVSVEPAPAGYDALAFLSITENDSAFCELFKAVGSDLLALWTNQRDAGVATGLVLRRLEHWRRFFQKEEGLGRDGYLGLCGELLFLERILDWEIDPSIAVESWMGPLGSNQDFLYGKAAVEVKSTSANAPEFVRVSSTRQLDDTGLDALFLSHSAFDLREFSGRTLAQIADGIEKRLSTTSPMAAVTLHERLLSAGFSPDLPGKYGSYGVVERSTACYEIRSGFPRIQESTLPPGISDVEYTLNLASCSEYMVKQELLERAIKEASGHACP